MECLAHHMRKVRSQQDASSLEGVRARLSVDPNTFKSTTNVSVDTGTESPRERPSGRRPHVCVVGAGMAGLRCAVTLARGGLKTTLLEARDRVGGRVHQVDQSGHLIDMGPNWIHGSKDNPMLHLAHQNTDTLFEPPDGLHASSPIFDADGKKLDAELAMQHSAIAWEIVDEAIRYSQEDCISIAPEYSLADYFAQAVEVRGYQGEKAKLILDLSEMWSNIVGEPIKQQSLRYMWLEECIEGENWFLASTYRAILDRLHQDCIEHVDLQLNKKVTQIKSVPSDKDGTSVLITTSDNDTPLAFDEVVATVPLGWLKHKTSTFTPPLPPETLTAIDHVGYGRLEKVYIHFHDAFWHTDDGNSKNPFIFQFLTPRYAPEHNSAQWTIECLSLAALPAPYNHSTLLFYINGPTSEYVTTLTRGCERGSAEHYQRLRAFFSPYYSLLPNYSAETCEPVDFCSTDWQNDEFAGYGSYSTYQTSSYEDGLVELDKDIEILRQGCPDRNLWFAGEHTAPTLALGTAAGAYLSGEAVADRILHGYGLSSGEEVDLSHRDG